MITMRSGAYKKTDAIMTNHIGIIDSGYRGEIMTMMKTSFPETLCEGGIYTQLVILPYNRVEITEAENLEVTDRGEGGFGSSDKVEEMLEPFK